jgi:hypothetical protein
MFVQSSLRRNLNDDDVRTFTIQDGRKNTGVGVDLLACEVLKNEAVALASLIFGCLPEEPRIPLSIAIYLCTKCESVRCLIPVVSTFSILPGVVGIF